MSQNRVVKDDLEVIGSVMAAWADYGSVKATPVPSAIEQVLAQYRHPVSRVMRGELQKLSRARANSTSMSEPFEHFLLPPVTAYDVVLYPVARLEVGVKSGVVCVSLRLTVYSLDASGQVRVRGWRYESADVGNDSGPRFHHFPHVQAITSWNADDAGTGIHPPGTEHPDVLSDSGVHESRPAFPLRCDRPFGVIVSAMGSLYGAGIALRILETVSIKPVIDEAKLVLCA